RKVAVLSVVTRSPTATASCSLMTRAPYTSSVARNTRFLGRAGAVRAYLRFWGGPQSLILYCTVAVEPLHKADWDLIGVEPPRHRARRGDDGGLIFFHGVTGTPAR